MQETYSDIFKNAVANCRRLHEAIDIVRANSSGDIWIIGGFVARNLAASLYGGEHYHLDIDFITHRINDEIKAPKGWAVEKNRWGNPKFRSENLDCAVDLSYLSAWHAISYHGLEPTIDNVLRGTPLTIQSIAYDLQQGVIIGEVGTRAIQDKTIAIYNRFQADWFADRIKRRPIEQIILIKAQEFNFTPIFD